MDDELRVDQPTGGIPLATVEPLQTDVIQRPHIRLVPRPHTSALRYTSIQNHEYELMFLPD
jgi:hypothetical protein